MTDLNSSRLLAVIEYCARHRGAVLLLTCMAAVWALWCLKHTPVDAIPDLAETQVVVFSEWPGRAPTLVEDQITYPVVSSLLSVPKVADVRGYSMLGMSFVYVIFKDGTDPYWARSRVLEYLSGLNNALPAGVRPSLGPDAGGVGWVMQYVLVDKSGKQDLAELRAFQDFSLKYALSSVPGVAEIASVGGFEKQYQVVADPARLRAFGLSLSDLSTAIRRSNQDSGGRVIEMAEREYSVRGRGYIKNIEDIASIGVGMAGRVPVRIADVADVRTGPQIRRGLLDWNGKGEAVGGIVVMRYGENASEVIARVKSRLDELSAGFPDGVEWQLAYDRSDLIHRAIRTLRNSLFEEMLVVSLVIIGFLLHLRSSLLPIISLPLSVLLAFIPMYLLGIPSTLMSLGGIAIALGATVDAEIVMVEAAHKALESAPPNAERRALLAAAARDVAPALFFSLLIIATAFLPVFALEGQAGKLFKPLAYTKTFVMVAAALLSITLAPALRDILLRGTVTPEAKHPLSRFLTGLYRPFVRIALHNPKSTLAIGLLALASALPLALRLGEEFMPPLDEGDLLYMPTTLPGISIEEAKKQLLAQDRVLAAFPEVASVFGKVGRAQSATDPAPLSMIETTLRLKPRSEWPLYPVSRWYAGWPPPLVAALRRLWPDKKTLTRDELVARLAAATDFAGFSAAWTMPIKARIDMQSTGMRTPVGLKILGGDLHQIEKAGLQLEHVLKTVPGSRSVFYERNEGAFAVEISPRRVDLARHGLLVDDINEIVETAIGGEVLDFSIEGRRRFSINLRYPYDQRVDLEAIKQLPVALPPTVPGEKMMYMPLSEVADIRIVDGPPMVRDENGLLAGYIYIDLDDARVDLASYVEKAQAAVKDALAGGVLSLPAGYFLKWSGHYEQLEQTRARLRWIVPLTIVLIGLLLFWHFGNLVEVLIVMLSVPFALVGSIWLLWLLDYRLSAAVWVGVIALVGLAAQTGVVMIVYIDNAYLRRKKAGLINNFEDIVDAHTEGTVQRLRPKLMTVLTMTAGLLPLLWAQGSGADVMRRIAAPMVGGLVSSTFLTLEIIPVVYTYWRYWQLKREQRFGVPNR